MNPAGAVAFFDRTTVAGVGKVTVTIAITLTPAIAARMNVLEGCAP